MIFNNNGGGEQPNDPNVTFGAGDVHYYIATGNEVDAILVEVPLTLRILNLPRRAFFHNEELFEEIFPHKSLQARWPAGI